jgi:hypothetical protein
MSVLDQVMQMKSQNVPESEIVRSLQEKRVSPKEIQEALSQAQVKKAVDGNQNPPTQGMQESIMENPPQEPQAPIENVGPQAPLYTPQTQEMPAYQEPAGQEYYGQDQYNDYYGEGYGGEYAYGGGGASDTGTLMEIAEQVFADKTKKIQKALEDLAEFKTLTESKIKLFEQRLKKIETTIDQLQISILEKIGSYGKNLSSVKKEMSMMQDSFGKVVGTALDKKSKRKS